MNINIRFTKQRLKLNILHKEEQNVAAENYITQNVVKWHVIIIKKGNPEFVPSNMSLEGADKA